MVSDDGNKNKPRNLFHRRVVKSYHKRQQIQQRMNTSTTTSSGEDGAAAAAYREDGDSVTEKRFRVRENEPIDKSSSNNSIITTTVESSSSSSSNNTNTTTVVEVLTESKELKYGFISMIGRRRVMEDAIKVGVRVRVRVMDNNEFMFFGVYDGHGGSRVSLACRERLHYIIEEELLELNRMDWEKVMMTSFSRMDEEVRGVGYEEDMGRTVGSSAMVVMVGKEVVVVANCGDCRTMLCNRGVTVPLSHDHKVTYNYYSNIFIFVHLFKIQLKRNEEGLQ